MMRVEVTEAGAGLHPSEKVISIETKDGIEELEIDHASILDGSISIGWPVGQDDDYFLVELPRETFRGFWRVWVPKRDVFHEDENAKKVA